MAIAFERHRCLEAARTLLRARKVAAAARIAHAACLAAAEALGVTADVPGHNLLIRQHAVLVLPTEGKLSRANADAAQAWRQLCEELERSHAVQAELFAMLGANE